MCREQKHRDAFLLALRRELDEAAKRNQPSRLLALLPKHLVSASGRGRPRKLRKATMQRGSCDFSMDLFQEGGVTR